MPADLIAARDHGFREDVNQARKVGLIGKTVFEVQSR